MIKKYLLALFVNVFLFSCASEPVNEEASPKIVVEKKTIEKKVVEPKPSDDSKPKPVPAKSTKYDGLEAAIASGSDEKIRSACIDILQSNSKDIVALNALAMNSYKKGQYEASVLLLDKVLSIEPQSSTAYSNLGLVSLARNEKNEAISYFKKSLDLDSANEVAATNLAALYIREKDYSKATSLLSASANSINASEALMTNYAVALSAKGKAEDAADIYNKLLKKYPGNKNAMMNLVIVTIDKLKKYDEGLDQISRLKFVAPDLGSRQVIKDLEIKAKAGLK